MGEGRFQPKCHRQSEFHDRNQRSVCVPKKIRLGKGWRIKCCCRALQCNSVLGALQVRCPIGFTLRSGLGITEVSKELMNPSYLVRFF